jgi:hypothetical protein
MKTKLATIIASCLASIVHCEDLELNNGIILKNYRIINHSAVDVMVIHDGGAENFSFELLPKEIQNEYGYKKEKAEQVSRIVQKGRTEEANQIIKQDNYISENSYGEKPKPTHVDKEDLFSPLPIPTWVGEKFIFIPLSKYDSEKGYIVRPRPKNDIEYIPYDRYKGKVFTVVEVNEEGDSYFNNYNVTIRMDESGQRLVLPTMLGNVKGIALKRDIDYARNMWLEKTLWLRNREASSYDADKDKSEFFKVKNLQPVKVKNILLSNSESWPLRFILENKEGDIFIKSVKLSGTNSERRSADSYKFKDVFFTEDPREKFNWSEKEFEAIEEGKVFRGMTKEQVLISWGKPLKINRTVTGSVNSEQWVYGGSQYLYFEGDGLTTFQN